MSNGGSEDRKEGVEKGKTCNKKENGEKKVKVVDVFPTLLTLHFHFWWRKEGGEGRRKWRKTINRGRKEVEKMKWRKKRSQRRKMEERVEEDI